ncbi:copper-binding protein [Ruegeria sediminis]|nr:copper-binding protein [Ruegeria sediminis]
MTSLKSLAASVLLIAVSAVPAFAETFTRGVVTEIDSDAQKVTIEHEELVDLGMPAMTMVFRLADPAMLETLGEGQEIEFVAERINGKLTVTKLQ